MESTRKILLTEMVVAVVLTVAVVLFFETDIMAPQMLFAEGQSLFVVTVVMELLTIACIPLALYLFRIHTVRRQLTEDAATASNALLVWGSVRMLMLCVPMVANTLIYYLSGLTVSFAYMAIILALCLFMVYPSKERCSFETTKERQQ